MALAGAELVLLALAVMVSALAVMVSALAVMASSAPMESLVLRHCCELMVSAAMESVLRAWVAMK
jgi:hypothetical protein